MKRKKPGARLNVVIDADVDELLRDVVANNRTLTLSGFVQDAIAVRLGNYEPPAAYVRRKRGDKGVQQAQVFDPAYFDRFGFPLAMQPVDPRFELKQASKAGQEGVRKLMKQYRSMAGMAPEEYADAELQETLRQLDAV